MRILVTRPVDDARRTAARLAAMGHEAILSPVIEIKPTGAAIANEKFDLVIATSSQALRYCGEQARILRELPLAVVGARTRRAAAKHGFRSPVHIAENAAALADHVKTSCPATTSILYLAGEERKPDLEANLTQAGFAIHAVPVYRAARAGAFSEEAADIIRQEKIDAALHFSRRSAAIFVALAHDAGLTHECARLKHLCLSADVAAGLSDLRADHVAIAERPSAEALLALI